MTKPSWGQKRTCQSCGRSFYDLCRSPIVCPGCGAGYDPDAVSKARRTRAPAAPAKKAVAALVVEDEVKRAAFEPREVPEEADELGDFEDEESSDDEDVIEDASELGEDEDDVAEVIDYVDDEDESKP